MDINDLSTLDAHENGAKMQVRDQNGKKIDVYFILAGMDSKRYRKAKTDLQRKILADKDSDMESMRCKALSEILLGWEGLTDKGNEVQFSKPKAEKLLLNAPYLMDQIDEFTINRANFTKG